MRRIYILALLLAGCGPRVIPDDKLKEIVRDIYLSNAYASSHTVMTDSLDIYEPLFSHYGYSLADFRHTLANFSRRKSSKLSDIITATHSDLERMYMACQQKVATIERIDSAAGARFCHIVRKDSLIRVRRLADTSKLTVKLPLEPGRYTVVYNILIDSADVNYGQRTTIAVEDSTGRKTTLNTQWLERLRRHKREYSFEANGQMKRMKLRIADFSNPTASATSITVDSLVIVRYLPRDVARDSMNRVLFGHNFVIDVKKIAADSLPAPLQPRRPAAEHGGDAR
ncbi:MAG: DUF4296 domain-containing protein [Rikenellaceae bacterium]|jgi:hypothetical protein|nr:DUF4296 domain-containing protein [Rikenellaceae bacterium]